MTGKLLVAALALGLGACAEPKYVSRQGVVQESARSESAGLEFRSSGLRAWVSWEKMPTEEDYGSFFLKVGRANRGDGSCIPLDVEGEFSVVLWMPSMGHGSSPVRLEKVDTGTYRVSDVFFTMPGDWEIRLQRKSAEFGAEETALAIRI